MHDQPGEHPGARLAGTSTEHGASCAIADAPEHHPGGDVPCDPTATRSASRVAIPPNSAATSRPLIKIGVIDGNRIRRVAQRRTRLLAELVHDVQRGRPRRHRKPRGPTLTTPNTSRPPQQARPPGGPPPCSAPTRRPRTARFRKVTGRCEPDRSTSSASDTARAYCESVRSHRVRRRGPGRLSTLSPIITTRVPLTTPDTGDPTELDAPIEPRGCPSARCGNARVPTARRERRPGVLATLRSAE